MKLNKTILIKASIEHVWSYLEDSEKQKQWMHGLVDIKKIDEVNAIIYIKEGGRTNPYNVRVLHSNPPSRLHILMYDDRKKFESTADYHLSKQGEFTSLEYLSEIKVNTLFMKIMMALLGKAFSNIMLNKMFKSLKTIAEGTYKNEASL